MFIVKKIFKGAQIYKYSYKYKFLFLRQNQQNKKHTIVKLLQNNVAIKEQI